MGEEEERRTVEEHTCLSADRDQWKARALKAEGLIKNLAASARQILEAARPRRGATGSNAASNRNLP